MSTNRTVESPATRDSVPAIDAQRLLDSCMGHSVFAILLLREFAETADCRIAEFELQSNHRDMQAVSELAHSLRGEAGIIGANALHEISRNLEMACQDPNVELAAELNSLYLELQRVQDSIPQVCARL